MNKLAKKSILYLVLFISIITSTAFASGGTNSFYLQVDKDSTSNISDIQYVSEKGLISRVSTVQNGTNLYNIKNQLKQVGDRDSIKLDVTFKPNVVINDYVYKNVVTMQQSFPVIKVPTYKFHDIYLGPKDTIADINRKLEESAYSDDETDKSSRPRFYFDNIGEIYDTFYGSKTATVKYQYKLGYLPLSKSVKVYRVKTIKATISKDMTEQEIENKLKSSINYANYSTNTIEFNSSDIKELKNSTSKTSIPFSIKSKEGDILYKGNVGINYIDKIYPEDSKDLVKFTVSMCNGLQKVDVIGDTKLYDSYFDGNNIIYKFKKGSQVDLKLESDNRYNFTRVLLSEDRDGVNATTDYEWKVEKNSQTITGTVPEANRNIKITTTLNLGDLTVSFKPFEPKDGILKGSYTATYRKMDPIKSTPSGYNTDLRSTANIKGPNIYDITTYTYEYNNIMRGIDYPIAEDNKEQKLYYASYGTGKIAIYTKIQDRDYLYVGDNLEDIIKGNRDIIRAENADLSKTIINPTIDTSKPSELVDPTNLVGDLKPSNAKVTYVADIDNDQETPSTKDVELKLKVVNKCNGLRPLTIYRGFEDNIAYKTDNNKGYIYNQSIQDEIKENIIGQINGKPIRVYLSEIEAENKSKSEEFAYYIDLGDPSHKDLPGFTKKDGNNLPYEPKDIKRLSGQINIKELVLYNNGKKIISLNSNKDMNKYKIGDKYIYRFGQFQFENNYVLPRISYIIGDNDRNIKATRKIDAKLSNITSNIEDVAYYRTNSNGTKEISGYNTGKFFIQNGKIAKTDNIKLNGKAVPNSTYFEKLIFNNLPEVGKNYIKDIRIEDTTDYKNNCYENRENCREIDFSKPTYDENEKDFNKRRLAPPYIIKSKVVVEYDPNVIKNENVKTYDFETLLDIVKDRIDNTPSVTKIQYISDAPMVYKGEVPDKTIIKNGIVIYVNGKKMDTDFDIVNYDTSELGNSRATIKIKSNGKEYTAPINILVVDKFNPENKDTYINIKKEKSGNNEIIYDFSGEREVKYVNKLGIFDELFANNFKRSVKYGNGPISNIIYDENESVAPDKGNRVVVNDIKFTKSTTTELFSGANKVYPSRIDMTIYGNYFNNNSQIPVEGVVKLSLILNDVRPNNHEIIDEIKLANKTYYLYHQVYDKNGNIGPSLLLKPSDLAKLYTPINIISNYKQLYTINFNYNNTKITNWSLKSFPGQEIKSTDLGEDVLSHLIGYDVPWDEVKTDSTGKEYGVVKLDSNPKTINLAKELVNYKINFVDKLGNPIIAEGIKTFGKIGSGTRVKDIIKSVEGYIPFDSEDMNKFNNFKFTKENNEVTITLREIPDVEVNDFRTNEKYYPGKTDINKFLERNMDLIAPKLLSTETNMMKECGIIEYIKVQNTDSDLTKLEDKTGELIIKYFDGQVRRYDFKYNYKIAYNITADQFKNMTIKVGEKVPSGLDWANNLTGIKSYDIKIIDFVENKPGKYNVQITVTDKNGDTVDAIYKTLTVLNKDEENPVVPENPTNPDTPSKPDDKYKPILPGEDLSPKNGGNTGNITEIIPKPNVNPNNGNGNIIQLGEEITPNPTDKDTTVVVPEKPDNGVVGNDNNYNNSSGGVIGNNNSNYEISDNNIAGPSIGSHFGDKTGNTVPKYVDNDTPSYEGGAKEDKKVDNIQSNKILSETIRYAQNIIINSEKYSKKTYSEFLDKYNEVDNIIKSGKEVSEDKAKALNEELVKTMTNLKAKGFFKGDNVTYVELDLRNAKMTSDIKDKDGNIIGKYELAGLPKLINNRTYLAIRDVANVLGINVDWDNSKRTATFMNNNNVVSINIDTKDVMVNGKNQNKTKNNIKLINDRIYCPLTQISKYFGISNGNSKDNVDQDIEYFDNGTVRIYIK